MTTKCPACVSVAERFWCNDCARHNHIETRAALRYIRNTIESRKNEISLVFDREGVCTTFQGSGDTLELQRAISLRRQRNKDLSSSLRILRERVIARRDLLDSIRYALPISYNV
jgi:hypothetical protein